MDEVLKIQEDLQEVDVITLSTVVAFCGIFMMMGYVVGDVLYLTSFARSVAMASLGIAFLLLLMAAFAIHASKKETKKQ